MKTLTTVLLILSVSFATAQENKVSPTNEIVEVIVNATEGVKANTIVLSTKGVKKLEDIQIETINETTYLELMLSSKKNKNIKTC